MKPYSNSTKLSERIEVKRISGRDEYGNEIWSTLFETYAQVSDRAGNEALVSAQEKRVSTAKVTFTMRLTQKSAQILPTDIVVWRGFEHQILTPTIFSDDRVFVSIETVRRY